MISARCVHWQCLACSPRCPLCVLTPISAVQFHHTPGALVCLCTGRPDLRLHLPDWGVERAEPGGSPLQIGKCSKEALSLVVLPQKKKKKRKKAKCTLSPGHNKFQQMEPPDLTTSSGLSLPWLLANQHGLSTQLESRFLQLLCLRGFPSRRAGSSGRVCPWGFSLP